MQSLNYYLAKFIKLYLSPSAIRDSVIDRTSRVCSGNTLNNVKVGRYSYIGHNCFINNCDIGNFCSIAGDCVIGGSSHPISWVSTSPVFHTKKNVLGVSFSKNEFATRKQTYIGHDVWIASRVMIKAGSKIGDGSIVGMGSIVTHDIPAYEIWAGNPAHMIRERFSEKTSIAIQKTQWWNLDAKELLGIADSFSDPIVFLEQFSKQSVTIGKDSSDENQ